MSEERSLARARDKNEQQRKAEINHELFELACQYKVKLSDKTRDLVDR